MGLIRYARPERDTASGLTDWSNNSTPTLPDWDVLDGEFRTFTVRGESGGVETDPATANQGTQFMKLAAAASGTHTLGFQPIDGDDSIASLTFHIYSRLVPSGSETVTIGRRVGTTDTDIGTITVTSATYSDLTLVAGSDGLSNGWSTALGTNSLSSLDQEFYIKGTSPTSIIRVARFYVAANFIVGPTLGKWKMEDNWRWCDECAQKVPYSRTVRPVAPHPQAGLVICQRCHDELDHETRRIMNASRARGEIPDILY